MGKIAIDVVLLPSDLMMDQAIRINRALITEGDRLIILDKEKCLPHISLCMGCMEADQIPEVGKVLDEIAASLSPFHLQAIRLAAEKTPSGKIVSVLQIKNGENLQRLHETVMKRFWEYLSYEVEVTMLFNPPEVEEETLYWIRNYAHHYHDPSLFDPHITAGIGKTDQLDKPIGFTASHLAVCQLGNYCTCRKVLLSSDLR